MSCDNNFKSQEHLKNLGTAVEIVSVHTDLHRHIVPISRTLFTIRVGVHILFEESILLTKMK